MGAEAEARAKDDVIKDSGLLAFFDEEVAPTTPSPHSHAHIPQDSVTSSPLLLLPVASLISPPPTRCSLSTRSQVADIRDDIVSFRFLAFYDIPKVKFVLDFAFYVVYVIQNTWIAIQLRQVNCSTLSLPLSLSPSLLPSPTFAHPSQAFSHLWRPRPARSTPTASTRST